MKKISKFLLAGFFSFSSCFICLGFASLSKSFTIAADVNMSVQQGLFICDVVPLTSGAESIGYSGSTSTTKITLKNNKDVQSFEITVYNNASETLGFNATKYIEEAYSNPNIIFTLDNLERRQEVEPKTYYTFTVNFKFSDKPSSTTDKTLTSSINYEFVPLDEIPEDEGEIAVHGALDQFRLILNTDELYNALTNQMDNSNANDRHDESYIGNVVGASESDKELLARLFEGNLLLNINGTDTEVKVMIKRENIDNNSNTGDENGNEMVVYLTTHSLQKTSSWGTSYAPVFAAIFTNASGSEHWMQCGDLIAGTAAIKQYNGWPGSGSFDTDTWRGNSQSGDRMNTFTIEYYLDLFYEG